MDFSHAVAHGGVSLKGAATGHGRHWTPLVGSAATTTRLEDADVGQSMTITFPDASARVELVSPGGAMASGALVAAIGELTVSGVTGTDAALVNGSYTRSASLYNLAPQWTKGTAAIRLATDGMLEITLAGVAQFRSVVPYVAPAFAGDDFEDAGGAGTAGAPAVVAWDDGAEPVCSVDLASPADPEGAEFPALASLRAFELRVTAGSGLVSLSAYGQDPIPLPLGGRIAIILPAATPAGLLPYVIFVASEDATAIQITAAAVGA